MGAHEGARLLRVLEGALTGSRDIPDWVERFARVGYVAKALLYGTVGLLAAGAAFGHGESTDTRGAMTKLIQAPFGRILLGAMALGLFGYAAWRCLSAFIDTEGRGNDAKGLAMRASFLVRGVAHLILGYSAARLALGHSAQGGDSSTKATGAAMHAPGGHWLVLMVAVGIGAFGLYQLYRAGTAKLSKQLDRADARVEVGEWVLWVSRIGIAARGLVFIAIAWLLGRAAQSHDASRAGGIDDALESLAQLGRFPYAAIGGGLIAYGVYQLLNARYRRMGPA